MRNTNISKRVGAPRTHWLPPRRDGEIQELEATAAPLPFSPRPPLQARPLPRCAPGLHLSLPRRGREPLLPWWQDRDARGRESLPVPAALGRGSHRQPEGSGAPGDGGGPCLASERRAGWVGGRGEFMVCVHFLAPEPGAPERWGPPRPKPRPGAAGAAATGGPRVPALCCAQAGKCPAGAAENESRGAQGTSLGDPRVCTRGLESRAPGAWRGIPGPA